MFLFTVNPAMGADKDNTEEPIFSCEKFHNIIESINLVDFKLVLEEDKKSLDVVPVNDNNE